MIKIECLKNKTVMVTGATGLIGQAVVKALIQYGASIVAVIRSLEKANQLFGTDSRISYIVSDINELEVKPMQVDYIIHAAANTSSKAFIEDPVGIIDSTLNGTRRTLEIARLSGVKGYIYLSSMEVYGTPKTDERIDELHSSNLNTMKARSAYPESKRMCENLCAAYNSQYGVPARIIRLTQTFGPGVSYHDGRVFAEFARCAIEGRNIVLHTKGETKRCYLHTDDAVSAILCVLLNGADGEAYNAANEQTYCSIYQMAELVAEYCSSTAIRVEVREAENVTAMGYAPTLHMNLDTEKLRSLGWQPSKDLRMMFSEMIADMKAKNKN